MIFLTTGKNKRYLLLHTVGLLQRQQAYAATKKPAHAPGNKRVTHSGIHHAHQRKNIMHPQRNVRFKSSDTKRLLETSPGGEPLTQGDKLFTLQ